MPLPTSSVFLDTQVFRQAYFRYDSERFKALLKHVEAGRVQVLLTDITIREVYANIRKAVQEAADAHRSFLRKGRILQNSKLEATKALLTQLDAQTTEEELIAQFDRFVQRSKALILPVPEDYLSTIVDRYFGRKPPFGCGKNKAEFPDAFVLEALLGHVRETRDDLSAITRDGGFCDACEAGKDIYAFKSLDKYLDAVASEDKRSDFLRDSLRWRTDRIMQSVHKEFEKLGFYVRNEAARVREIRVTKISMDDSLNILSLFDDVALVNQEATIYYSTVVDYEEPRADLVTSTTFHGEETRTVLIMIATDYKKTGRFQVEVVTFDDSRDVAIILPPGQTR